MFMRKAAAVREPTDESLGLVSPVEGDVTNTGISLPTKITISLTTTVQFEITLTCLQNLSGCLEHWKTGQVDLHLFRETLLPEPIIAPFVAADHCMAKDIANGGMGCSAYPSSVSRKVAMGLDNGLTGASVLEICNHVNLHVIDVGLDDRISKCKWLGKTVQPWRIK
ncbi:LOW QUALITY PROTEIN: hypothetical protein ACHAW6_009410 [Cyclotella cf. meneghiniana]